MIELQVTQGSEAWHQARAKCFNASEAPAMQGVSPYKTRSALLAEKATGIVPEVDAATQARFDAGHMVEALARPLVEAMIDEELYQIVATDDSGKYLASSDGATMLCNIGFEHKLWNADIAAQVVEGNVPESHRAQLDHQFLVFGFDKIIFVCSDGTAEKMVHCWYYPQPERIAALKAGWEQFATDLANYQHTESKPAAVAEKIEGLPALFMQVEGKVVASNMAAFKGAAELFLSRLPKAEQLQTDQDFANADQAAKDCKDAEDKLQIVKSQAQSQAVSIDEAFRAIDSIGEKIRSARLSLEKVVKAEKENRKSHIIGEARGAYVDHCVALTARVGVRIEPVVSFSEAVKGLKSLDSMRDKVSVALANAKIEANAIADRIDANRKTVEDMSLFPDFAQVCTKAPDDFAALLAMRANARKEAEARRLEAERERIRAEEQAKAQREAQARADTEQAERNRVAAEEIRRLDAERKASMAASCVEELPKSETQPALSSIGDTQATIKLGEICQRLGFTVNAEFIASLGIQPSATDKNAKLYPASKFPTICRLISEHVMALAFKKAA
ncbi:MAG: YqaJ viral recombinase family protein [Ferribacterium limneticum]